MAEGQGSTPPRLRAPRADQCPGGDYGSPYPYMRNGKIFGCPLPGSMGDMTMDQAAKKLCWTGTTFVAAAIAALTTVTFEYEVKWWWQLQEFLNLGDQVARTFELTDIGYGQSAYNLQIKELTVDGTLVLQQGVDVRNWNFEIYQRFYPIPASGLNDPVALEFTNVTAVAEDFAIGGMGPAVLQIG